jgi:Flp pilus assembly protein CpaB
MYTARIVVPTIALSAGGVAAYLASGSDNKTLPTEPEQTETLARGRQSGTLSLALRGIVDVNMIENETGDQALKRGESINVVRYGVLSATTTQK